MYFRRPADAPGPPIHGPMTAPADRASRSAEALHRLGERAIAGTWFWSFADDELVWSVGLFRIFGLDPATPPSVEAVDRLTLPDDRPDRRRFADLLHGGRYETRHFRIRRADGEIRWLTSRGVVGSTERGEPAWLAGIVVDETDRVSAAPARRGGGARGAALARLTGSAPFLADRRGEIVEPPDWTAFVGIGRAPGHGWLAGLDPQDAATVERDWRAAVAEDRPFSVAARLGGPAAGRPVDIRAVPLQDDAGRVAEWVGVVSAADTAAVPGPAPTRLIGGAHVRAARTLLGWSAADLAGRAGVSLSTVRRIEDGGTTAPVRPGRLEDVRAALEAAGIVFAVHPDGRVAVVAPG